MADEWHFRSISEERDSRSTRAVRLRAIWRACAEMAANRPCVGPYGQGHLAASFHSSFRCSFFPGAGFCCLRTPGALRFIEPHVPVFPGARDGPRPQVVFAGKANLRFIERRDVAKRVR